ncbi:hypothetical protein ACTFIY_001433 [Dictyostelium cf. discoideum]
MFIQIRYGLNVEVLKSIEYYDYFNVLDHPITNVQIDLKKFNQKKVYGNDIVRYHQTINNKNKFIFPQIQSCLVINGIKKYISPFHMLDNNLNVYKGKSAKIIILANSPTNYIFPKTLKNFLFAIRDFHLEGGDILFTNVCPIFHSKDNNYEPPSKEAENLIFFSILNVILSNPTHIITSGYESTIQFSSALEKLMNVKNDYYSISLDSTTNIKISSIPHLCNEYSIN